MLRERRKYAVADKEALRMEIRVSIDKTFICRCEKRTLADDAAAVIRLISVPEQFETRLPRNRVTLHNTTEI